MIARTVYGEARGCAPDEQALVVWCILQRVDDARFPDTIADVVTQPSQFHGYSPHNPVDDAICAVVATELDAWAQGADPPILPPYATATPYLFLEGSGWHNFFRGSY
jgi:Cell wall hydrolyses involved in spore germination